MVCFLAHFFFNFGGDFMSGVFISRDLFSGDFVSGVFISGEVISGSFVSVSFNFGVPNVCISGSGVFFGGV